MDIDADPDMTPVQPTVFKDVGVQTDPIVLKDVGVQTRPTVGVPMDEDPDITPVPPTLFKDVGVQTETMVFKDVGVQTEPTVDVPLDENPEMLVPLKNLVSQVPQVLTTLSTVENQPADIVGVNTVEAQAAQVLTTLSTVENQPADIGGVSAVELQAPQVLTTLSTVENQPADIVRQNAVESQAPQVLETLSTVENQPADNSQTENFTWQIENWSKINLPHISSETFVIRGYKWCVLLSVLRKDGEEYGDRDYLALYLKVPDSAELSLSWSRFASFSLAVVNQHDPKLTVRRGQMHHFNQDSKISGFHMFLSTDDIYHPTRGFIVNDSLIIQTKVYTGKVADCLSHLGSYNSRKETGFAGLKNQGDTTRRNDSRKETGFVGLRNQGATCYLNSLIQTLYHLPLFRRAVYSMPTSQNASLSESMPLALQSLFCEIQYGDTSPETEELTKSLEWDPSQHLIQEDVHEFNLKLFKILEEQMKGTPADGTIQQLFQGHVTDCIKIRKRYRNVKTITKTQSFYDLQLDVKGCRDVYQSLDKYIEVETLEGKNQYQTKEFGLQHATKQTKFIDFPPVLQLHLKRFQYNTDPVSKVNDRYEFPLQLDLDRKNRKYLSSYADRSVRNLFKLHSVLVHSGASPHSGHYYAFIRPTLSDQWYKFNDDLVTKEEVRTVLEEHYGGETKVEQHREQFHPEFTSTPSKSTKDSNAYILLYVREFDEEKVMCSVDQEDISKHSRVRLEEEAELRNTRNTEANHVTAIRVSLNEDLGELIGKDIRFDLVDVNKVQKFRVRKLAIFDQVRDELAKELSIPFDRLQRFWLWSKRNNGSYPLAKESEVESPQQKVHALYGGIVLNLFSEVVRPGVDPGVQAIDSEFLLFLKLYIPETKALMYEERDEGRIFVIIVTEKPVDILERLEQIGGFMTQGEAQHTEVALRPVVTWDHIGKQGTFEASELEKGDIICYQKTLTREEAERCCFPDEP